MARIQQLWRELQALPWHQRNSPAYRTLIAQIRVEVDALKALPDDSKRS